MSDAPAGSPPGRPGKLHASTGALLPLTLTAIGVVYGDIGTSPLYTIRECFFGSHSVPVTDENVLGVLSLIIYALLVVISVKYIAIVMRADNRGEGGILALAALVPQPNGGNGKAANGKTNEKGSGNNGRKARVVLIALGIFGAALLYGDGMITPAITVLGAVEGLTVATPMIDPYVVPIAVVILIGIFAIQQHGTHRVGRLFGPVMVVWFITIAVLGVTWIVKAPVVLWAIDPRHALTFFEAHGLHGFAVLGAVFLAVTGGEALYADMGHFGKRPIRVAWFTLVLPALLINYFGQGALLMLDGSAAEQPFFLMAPSWALLPLVVLATAAAIIASQALISGAFSLTQQAVQLGYSPRLDIDHTSSQHMGQIYVPQVNWALMVGTIAIVLGFRSSSALAAAYGIAVTLTMVITTLLLHAVATERWKWPVGLTMMITGPFLAIDLAFFGANLLKVFHGGWLPLVIGGVLFSLMTTWKTGRQLLYERLIQRAVPLEEFVTAALARNPTRVPGTAVFMTAQPQGTPAALVHNLRHNKVLHERVIILSVQTTQTPHVPPDERLTAKAMGKDLFNAVLRYGFMDEPNVPEAMAFAIERGLLPPSTDVTYFLGRETVIVSKTPGMAMWRERLFVLMAKNAVRATAFFKLPPDNVVELGVQVEI